MADGAIAISLGASNRVWLGLVPLLFVRVNSRPFAVGFPERSTLIRIRVMVVGALIGHGNFHGFF